MSGLVALTSGSSAETRTFAERRYRRQLTDVVYTLGDQPFDGAAGVWVPEGTPRRRLLRMAPRLDEVLAAGGTVLLFGDHQAGWPPTVEWTFRRAGHVGDTRVPADSAWAGTDLGLAAGGLHHHGVLSPPPGAQVLLAAPDGAAVAYLDSPATGGTLLVSTIDPLAHFGQQDLAVAGDFLDLFLPWVSENLLGYELG